jgi:hypothetical protein
MKKFLVFGFVCFYLLSCGDESSKPESEDVENIVLDEVVRDTVETGYYEEEDPTISDYSINDFPKSWIMLEEEGPGFAIIDFWDSQIQRFELVPEDEGGWFMELTQAQDSDGGPISNFKATIEEGEGISIVSGSFTYESGYYEILHEITFEWDQLRYYAEFQNIPLSSNFFVPEESRDFFETIVVEREED